jgi:F-type H+-transporting ATPase subunit alpha
MCWKGKRNVEILKQGLNDPYTVEDQAIIYAGSKTYWNVPVNKVENLRKIWILEQQTWATLDALKAGKLTDEITDVIKLLQNYQNITSIWWKLKSE